MGAIEGKNGVLTLHGVLIVQGQRLAGGQVTEDGALHPCMVSLSERSA